MEYCFKYKLHCLREIIATPQNSRNSVLSVCNCYGAHFLKQNYTTLAKPILTNFYELARLIIHEMETMEVMEMKVMEMTEYKSQTN